ncbi:DnaJ family domain-containing protein [Kibdelosporangium aridum]|uniref:DnaJ family domain-containing protein n=1 Tax=Kibdelosporangium aridum TaxID=2030 RepID=UPI0035E542A7
MTERKPSDISFETWVDRQVRMARERGDFDDLPGTGKPLPGAGKQVEDDWWLKDYMKREGLTAETLLPTPLRLRKQIERLPETVRELRSEREVRELVAGLNAEIVEWLRAPSGPFILRVGRVDVEEVVARWRASRPKPPPAPPAEPARSWWRWPRRDRKP